jgi:hypothetical protein
MTEIPMTEFFSSPLSGEKRKVRGVLVNWVLDNWNLFGVWNLNIEI